MTTAPAGPRPSYLESEAWKDYVKGLDELASAALGALSAAEALVSSLVGRQLADVARDGALLGFVLGGARLGDDTVELPEDSMARFSRDVLGIGLAEEDLRELAGLLRRGARLENIRGLAVRGFSRSSGLLALLRDAGVRLRTALESLGAAVSPTGYPLTPEGVLDALYTAVNAAGPLLPAHNIIGFLIYSTSQVPLFYAEDMYPELSEGGAPSLGGAKLDLLSLTLVEDPLGRRELSIVGHGPVMDSVSRALGDMMRLIDMFGRPELCAMVEYYASQAVGSAVRRLGTLGRELLSKPRDVDLVVNLNGEVSIRQLQVSGVPYEDVVEGLAPAMASHVVEIVRVGRETNGYGLRLRVNRCPGEAR